MVALHAYKGRTVGVFGLGKAGRAAIEAMLQGGARVYAWDDSENSRKQLLQEIAATRSNALQIEHHANWPWAQMVCMVLSPGVPLSHPKPHPVVDMAVRERVKIMGEVDLLHEACPEARFVGITGTNGKSTTTALLGFIFQQCGVQAQVGANLGVPALALRAAGKEGIYVLEMSSYQLDLVKTVVFEASVLLNLTPDHLERHGGMEGYVAAKRRIFDRQQDNAPSFIGLDDGYCRDIYISMSREHRSNIIPVTVTQPQAMDGIRVDAKGVLHDKTTAQPVAFDLSVLEFLKGSHNWQNIAAAYGVARHFGLAPQQIMEKIALFPGLPHRLEKVAQMGHVAFINDSKATNADATARALEPFDNIYWIAGGRPKAGGIAPLTPYFGKIRHAFLIGEAQEQFAGTLEGKVTYSLCNDLATATQNAARFALRDAGGPVVVLLSPACASFDQWPSFEARGDAFRAYVRDIQAKGI